MSEGDGSAGRRARGRVWRRLFLHPAFGLALFTAFVWNMQHWPRQHSRPVSWPPGVKGPIGSPVGRGPECRVLAWVYRDAGAWRFVTTPGPGEEDSSACTVAVLFENGRYGVPYPTETGLRSTRAIMNRREKVTDAEAESIYAAALERFGGSEDSVEAFLASYLSEEHVTETHRIPYGRARNVGALVLAGAGILGGLWTATLVVGAVARWQAALALREREREMLKSSLCPVCGYDLRGLPERRCPECGFGWPEAPAQA